LLFLHAPLQLNRWFRFTDVYIGHDHQLTLRLDYEVQDEDDATKMRGKGYFVFTKDSCITTTVSPIICHLNISSYSLRNSDRRSELYKPASSVMNQVNGNKWNQSSEVKWSVMLLSLKNRIYHDISPDAFSHYSYSILFF
jgi:hypothetical protein